jgi:hypothetical protein
MSLKPLLSFVGLLLFTGQTAAQDYYSYGSGNYTGICGVIANPAAAANNKLKLDLLGAGFDVNFNNSWLAVKQRSLGYPNMPPSWKNSVSNLPDNIYKNFVYSGRQEPYSVILEQRFMLPSVMFELNPKNSFAFTWSLRQIGNVDGISSQLAHLFENEFDLSVTRNNRIQNKSLHIMQMSWIEYGFTYARVFNEKGRHVFKAGITPKLLQGVQAAYVVLKDLDFLFSNKDTLSYFNADVSFARSSGMTSAMKISPGLADRYRHATTLHPGLDIGFIYEWRRDNKKGPPTAGAGKATNDEHGEYILKFGASLVDFGKIKFRKQTDYYDLALSIDQEDIIRYISSNNIRMVDSMLRVDFPVNTGPGDFTMYLPTAFNMQLDYSVYKSFFLNLSSHITQFNSDKLYKVHNYNAVCIAPRYESYWLDVSLPVTYNTLSARRSAPVTPGFSMRAGPLTIGSSDLGFLFRNDLPSLNFYAILRLSVTHRQWRQLFNKGNE